MGVPAEVTTPSPLHALTTGQLLEVYRAMSLIRTLDERMMTLQRQGRIGFYGACTGQEAACIGSAYALRTTDWIFPALREGAAMLLRGFPLVPYLAPGVRQLGRRDEGSADALAPVRAGGEPGELVARASARSFRRRWAPPGRRRSRRRTPW